MDFATYFKDKKITVMGLGLLGRGVGDVMYMAKCGAKIIVTDLKTDLELKESVDKLKDFQNVTFVLGEHRKEDFKNRDMILVAAGVPRNSPYLATAREAKVRLVQSAALFAELSKIPIVGITGTRGKSTVSAMVYHVLSVTTGEHIIFGGNVRGISNLQLLKEVQEDSIAVMELDSWQLQGFGWAEISPQIAVFTNFMDDHLKYYMAGGRSIEEARDVYFKDKAQIFLHQEESGVFITTPDVFEQTKKLRGSLGQEVVLADASVLPEDCLLSMPGEHNRLNAALAYETLKAISLSDEDIFEGLASFSGVDGRLQYMKEIDGVRIFNDNSATTPQATIAALEALDVGNKNIVLIVGGSDKGIDSAALAVSIAKHCKQVILTPGDGTELLIKNLRGQTPKISVDNLQMALNEAMQAAKAADIILFSPAYASFAQYKNEYERGDEFVRLINDL